MSKSVVATVCATLVLPGIILALAAAARADDPPPPSPGPVPHVVVVVPRRIGGPSAEDMARFYPQRAQRLRLSGDVLLHCMVTPAGALDACAVTSETPPDQGFGAAALRLTSKFKYAPLADPTPHDIHIKFVPPS